MAWPLEAHLRKAEGKLAHDLLYGNDKPRLEVIEEVRRQKLRWPRRSVAVRCWSATNFAWRTYLIRSSLPTRRMPNLICPAMRTSLA